jgi:hypothetical protein
MNDEALKESLKRIVVEETLKYGKILRVVEYNERLMKSNYILAKLYSQKNREVKARVYLKEAEHQLVYLNKKLGQRGGFSSDDIGGMLEEVKKRRKEEKKFSYWSKKIFDLGDMLR